MSFSFIRCKGCTRHDRDILSLSVVYLWRVTCRRKFKEYPFAFIRMKFKESLERNLTTISVLTIFCIRMYKSQLRHIIIMGLEWMSEEEQVVGK